MKTVVVRRGEIPKIQSSKNAILRIWDNSSMILECKPPVPISLNCGYYVAELLYYNGKTLIDGSDEFRLVVIS